MDLKIDGYSARIEWSDRLIKDFHGLEARLYKGHSGYEVSEILTPEQNNNFVLMKRFERLREMKCLDKATRDLIFYNILELKK